MDQLTSNLDKLLQNKDEDPSHFYTYLSDCTLTEQNEKYFVESFIPKVYYLYEKQILRKNLIYLSLLASQNNKVLQKFLDYDKSIFVLNINDPVSLFDYYIYKNKHWVYEIINKPEAYNKIIPLTNIYSKLNMLKYINETNMPQVDIEHLHSLSSKIDLEYLDDFWKFYIEEINRFIDNVKFCKPLVQQDVTDSELFTFTSSNSFLDTLSNFVDLSDPNHWDKIINKLKSYSNTHEFNVFTGFIIIATLVKLLIQANDTNLKKEFGNGIFEKVKTWLLELDDKELQVELLENIFYLMFYRNKNEFSCKEKEIRFILCLLKSVIEELQMKKVHDKDSDSYKKSYLLNNYVTDALWRLDLIINTKMTPKIEERILNYMLAPPDSLIHFCLKRRNFERAYQVIEIFNLRDSDLSNEVNYAEVFITFKKSLRKNGKIKPLDTTVEEFFQSNPPYVSKEVQNSINNLVENFDYLTHFKTDNETFINIFDLALTETRSWEETEILLRLAQDKCNLDETITSGYLSFYKRIVEVAKEIGSTDKVSLPEILTNPKYSLNVQSYKTKKVFFKNLSALYDVFQQQIQIREPGVFNKNHPSHRTLVKLNELCHSYILETSGTKEPFQYLLRTFNYLKAFSKILYIEENCSDIVSQGKNSSYFNLLEFNRSELTGRLLFERHLDPTEFEKYFAKLKLDFLYHVVGNCFPTINLHVQENVTIEELYHDNMLYIPSPSIIVYIQKRNWLLAFILTEMYKVEGVKIDISELRLKTFFNYLKLPKIQHLKVLFEDNDIIAALQNCISAQNVKSYFREKIVEHDLESIHSHNSSNSDSLETGEEILEESKTTNWKNLYDIIESIPENQLKKKLDLVASSDNILVNIVQDGFESDYYRYIYFISDRDLRIDTIFNNFKKWPGKIASDVIKAEVSRFEDVLDSKVEALRDWLQHIELNEELKTVFDRKTWYKSYNFCKNYPEKALNTILNTNQVDHLLDFISLYKLPEDIICNVSSSYITRIMDLNIPLSKIKDLLDHLPFQHSIDVCYNLLTVLRNLEHLEFIVGYINNNVTDDILLKKIQVSLKILTVFTVSEQDHLFCLISEPLDIFEVLLMNTKLDKLAAILELFNMNSTNDYHEDVISVEKVDELLRKYAEKSLDFRVITHPSSQLQRTPEAKLLQSLDSLSLASDRKQFVVPETVPTKEEWVKNDEVVECMCCLQVTFSMFNRRHHCRRCGRVVCYGCSVKRMLVPTYGDIMVRVCSDCFSQTCGGTSDRSDGSDLPSSKSFIQELWLLNDDPEHNKIVREEFSYEHAPSTSLCFSILKYHSKNSEYSKFLLKQCEIMLRLLQPNQEPTYEIDYLLVIKMLKSIATAAKIASAEIASSSTASMADRILSQAELLGLLAERGCLNLMSLMGDQNLYIDATILRKLRDKLLQREQWHLALEVSTKAGLDNSGVFAAWGKSCLKAGSLLIAREKFQRCLDKNSQYETSSVTKQSDLSRSLDSLSLSRLGLSRTSLSSAISATENKPSKDPPLLHEIIQILETKTRTIRHEVLEKSQKITSSGSMTSLSQTIAPFTVHTDTAISVINRLKNLKEIASGNFVLSDKKIGMYSSKPPIDPIFYDECLYYLSKYGTNLSLLEFYVRHGDIYTALTSIVDNRLHVDLFIEIYMKCLKDGNITILQEEMSHIDSSLNIWKDYLQQLCRHLEKQRLLNCLYQLQLYIGDYVRASMTCIRFYESDVKNFTDLAHNVNHLYKGEEHLKQILEQEQWVEVASVGNISTISRDSFEERMLSNPDLVMKIDTKDVNRHLNTVKRQVEIVDFLAQRESSGVNTRELLRQLLSFKDPKKPAEQRLKIPTLFGSTSDQINLAVMAIVSGETANEGFQLAIKIIEEFKLRHIKVYCLAGKQLAKSERYNGISQLVNCIKSTGINDSAISDMLDEMLTQAVGTLIRENKSGTKVEDLIKLIKDKATKISAYIEAKQLKTAYFLAVKYRRTADIRRIQTEAELLNMPTIKALCQKVLQNAHSKES